MKSRNYGFLLCVLRNIITDFNVLLRWGRLQHVRYLLRSEPKGWDGSMNSITNGVLLAIRDARVYQRTTEFSKKIFTSL